MLGNREIPPQAYGSVQSEIIAILKLVSCISFTFLWGPWRIFLVVLRKYVKRNTKKVAEEKNMIQRRRSFWNIGRRGGEPLRGARQARTTLNSTFIFYIFTKLHCSWLFKNPWRTMMMSTFSTENPAVRWLHQHTNAEWPATYYQLFNPNQRFTFLKDHDNYSAKQILSTALVILLAA